MTQRITTQEIGEIRKRVEDAREYGHGVGGIVFGDVPALLAEVERLRTALEFYAEYANYNYGGDAEAMKRVSTSIVTDDFGNRAREAIRNEAI